MSKCECSLRTKLVGDGCDVCNPELAKELATADAGSCELDGSFDVGLILNCANVRCLYHGSNHMRGSNGCMKKYGRCFGYINPNANCEPQGFGKDKV
jgi:hypothetical protein